jgi:hypothetical protein
VSFLTQRHGKYDTHFQIFNAIYCFFRKTPEKCKEIYYGRLVNQSCSETSVSEQLHIKNAVLSNFRTKVRVRRLIA